MLTETEKSHNPHQRFDAAITGGFGRKSHGFLGLRLAHAEISAKQAKSSVLWNSTDHLGAEPRAQGETLPDKLLVHIAPLGWEHISFTL